MAKEKKESSSWFSWRITDKELDNQVKNYKTLDFTESYRGISVMIVLGLLALSILLGFLEIVSLSDALGSVFIYLPVVFFVFKGHRWAMIVLMILWTFEKGYTFFSGIEATGTPQLSQLFWWAILMPYFYKALKVENARKSLTEQTNHANLQANSPVKYCTNCGKPISGNENFCSKCGGKLS